MSVNGTAEASIVQSSNATAKDDVEAVSIRNDVDFNYVVAPFFTLVFVVLLVILVVTLFKRKRRIDRLRHNLMPFYNFAPGEEDDWETELLDSDGESRRV